jgi:hypothetical protein
MFRISTCRIDAKLTKGLNDAIRIITQLELTPTISPLQASEKYVAAESAWIEHKISCQFCSGQQVDKVH